MDKIHINGHNKLKVGGIQPNGQCADVCSDDVATLEQEMRNGLNDTKHLVDFLELVLDNVYSGIIVCDIEGTVIYMNQVYAELLCVDRKDAVGKNIQSYFPSSRLTKVVKKGRAELGQKCSLRTELPLLVNRIPLINKGKPVGAILQTVFRDYQHFTDLLARLNLLEKEVKFYKKGLTSVLSATHSFDSIIGKSKAITEVKERTLKYADSDAPVLITGPTGTGKELFAHAVHNASARAEGPFVCVNCAAIPYELFESELFGYESGAFTGASKKGKPGKIELANGGTLYLDEIGELPLPAQAKLLRVLDNKTLDRVGGVESLKMDFRLVAATNRSLPELIEKRRFREDFFYRMNSMTVQIPPLAEREGDIPILTEHFLVAMGKARLRVSRNAMDALTGYHWPGNVRELKNVIEHAVSLAENGVIDRDHFPRDMFGGPRDLPSPPSGFPDSPLADEMARFEASFIREKLELYNGNMSKVSKILGISRSTLYEKCKKHGIG